MGLAQSFTVGLIALTAPAAAQPSEESAENDIIVTGERGSRSVRETPSSVAVFTSDMIETLPGADRLDQLLELIPNVTLGTGNLGPSIRGQDSTGPLQDLPAFLGGNRPRVTLQVDGRAVGFNEFVFGVAPLWDVQQVEVFRSPQSTTQGRNSIAGAIFVSTRDPVYRWEAGARALASSFNGRQFSGVISGPLIQDQLAFRIAGDLRRGRTAARIANNTPGADPNDDDFSLLRFKLLAEPDAIPGARLQLSYSHTESQSIASEVIRPPFRERRNPFGAAGVFTTRIDALTGSLGLDLQDALRLQTTVSHGDSHIDRYPPPGLGRTITDIDDGSIESILNWNPDGPLRMTGGVHYLRSRLRQFIDLSAVIGLGEFDDRQHSLGLFGEATLRLLPRMALTAGLRHQRDSQRRNGQLGNPSLVFPIDFNKAFQALLPKVSVTYEVTEGISAGLLVQRAYNPGGVTLNFDTGEEDRFDAESLWACELFTRAVLLGGRLKLSANLFANDIRDAQRATFFPYRVPGGGTAFWAEIDNIPKARSHGLEASADWRLDERLRVRGAIGLLKTRIVEPLPSNPSLKGNDFGRSPAFTGSASVDWTPIDRLRLNASVRHNSPYFSDDANSLNRKVGRATRVDARAAYDFGRVAIFAYGRNLLDDFNMTYLFSPVSGVAADPREIGIGIEAGF